MSSIPSLERIILASYELSQKMQISYNLNNNTVETSFDPASMFMACINNEVVFVEKKSWKGRWYRLLHCLSHTLLRRPGRLDISTHFPKALAMIQTACRTCACSPAERTKAFTTLRQRPSYPPTEEALSAVLQNTQNMLYLLENHVNAQRSRKGKADLPNFTDAIDEVTQLSSSSSAMDLNESLSPPSSPQIQPSPSLPPQHFHSPMQSAFSSISSPTSSPMQTSTENTDKKKKTTSSSSKIRQSQSCKDLKQKHHSVTLADLRELVTYTHVGPLTKADYKEHLIGNWVKIDIQSATFTDAIWEQIFSHISKETLKTLCLQNNKLTSIHQGFAYLTNLEQLNLSRNLLTTLSKTICSIVSLQQIDISYNKIKELYSSAVIRVPLMHLQSLNLAHNRILSIESKGGNPLSYMPALTSIDLGHNKLATLELPELPKLTSLSCNNNKLPTIDGLERAPALQRLNINGNQFHTLPDTLQESVALTHLDASNNPLTTSNLPLPPTLTHLSINNSGLKQFPRSILQCASLKLLDIGNNSISELPEELVSLKNLESIRIDNNTLKDIPKTIIDSRIVLHISHEQLQKLPQATQRALSTKQNVALV